MAEDDSEETSEPETTDGGTSDHPFAKSLAGHEFNAEDRTSSHRLVATAMIITFLVVAISQDWWKHLRDWIGSKTHGDSTKSKPGG